MSQLIDNELGRRVKTIGFDYSEIFSGYAGELPQNNTMNPAIIMYLLN